MDFSFSKIKNTAKEKLGSLWKSGGVHVISGSFLNKFVAFFGSIVIVRLLTKADYGGIRYVENLYNFFFLVAGMGISNAVLRFVVLEDDLKEKKSVYRFMARTALIFNVALVLIGLVINRFYPHNGEFGSYGYLLYIMLLMLPAQYFNDNSLTLERAMFDNRRFAYLNLGFAVTVILGKVIGAWRGNLLVYVILGVAIQLGFAIYLGISNHRKYFREVEAGPVPGEKKKRIITYSLQYMVTNGMWALFMLLDVYLLGRILNDPEIIADYNVAFTWPANVSIICQAAAMFINPYFIKNENDPVWVRKNFRTMYGINFLAVLAVSVVMIVLAKPLIFINGGPKYYNVIPLMRIIVIGSLINNGLRYMIANCLAAMGRIKVNMAVSVVGVVTLAVLDMLLIPRFHEYGPAYAGIIVHTVMAAIMFVAFNREYHIIGGPKAESLPTEEKDD
ncbi:MAG: oligosaccharide flippase family protein [Clostridia bacterium]|nr:oligosaccharide flippase family protein [Clostridia bacterium]